MSHDEYSPWENIQVATRCEVKYGEMQGNGPVRFCQRCELNVYDLSGLSQEKAEKLIVTTEGSLCTRFYRRHDGTILTSDCRNEPKESEVNSNSLNVWADLFGPSKEAVWRQLCAEINAEYIDGGFWYTDKVVVTHKVWTITLDTYNSNKVVYTRIRAPYVNPVRFHFKIWRRGFFSDIGLLLGMQDIEIGHAKFDRDFIIQGNNPEWLRALFASQRLRDLIEAQPEILLTVQDDEGWFGPQFPDGVDELHLAHSGVIKDKERLKLLFDLFAETLDQLCRIGSTENRSPRVNL